MRLWTRVLGPTIAVACLAFPAGAVLSVGQIDTFEDGTTQGWIVGDEDHPAPPVNIATGGPAGADDHYLQLTAQGGRGAGSKLSSFNVGQWAGNYVDAGIGSISLDVRNNGPDAITLRLLVADPVAGPPANVAVSNGVLVPAGSGWTPAVFALDPASMTAVLGNATTALTNATELRLFHNPAAEFPGPPTGIPAVTAVVGVDNIRAGGAIPEPSSMALLSVGLTALLARRRALRGR